jgi:hypothetical protein
MKKYLLLLPFFAFPLLGFGEKSYATLLEDHEALLKEHKKVRKGMFNEINKFLNDVQHTQLKKGENPFSDGPVSETKNHGKWRLECSKLYKERELHPKEYNCVCKGPLLEMWEAIAEDKGKQAIESENEVVKQRFLTTPRKQWPILLIEVPDCKNILERFIAMDLIQKKADVI